MKPIIENYLYHVGRYLPQSQKKDILDELRANIYDQLEATDRINDDKQIEALLLELGSPSQVARSYTQETRCLIGPELIDIYWTVVKWVLLGVMIAYAVLGVVKLATVSPTVANITQMIIQFLAQTWQSGLSIYGTITLVFVVVYHFLRDTDDYKNSLPHSEDNTWDYNALKALKTPPEPKDLVKKSESVGSIIGTIVGFLLLNAIAFGANSNLWIAFAIEGIGTSNIETTSLAAINQTLLHSWMFAINLLLVVNLILHVYLLIQGKWSIKTRAIDVVLEILGLIVFLSLWLNPTFIDWSKASSVLTSEVSSGLATSLSITRTIVAAVVTGFSVYTVFDHIRKSVTRE